MTAETSSQTTLRRRTPLLDPTRKFTVEEGRWLKALNALFSGKAFPRFDAVSGPFPAPDVIHAGIHLLATSGLRLLLLDAHGHRPKTVLRDEERRRGSIFDTDVNGDFRLRYSLAARDAWLGLARSLPLLTQEERGIRFAKKAAREAIIVDDTLTGDWLFYRQIADGISRGLLFSDNLLPLRRRLWRGSPLAALAELRPQPPEQLDKLLSTPSVRLVELYSPQLLTTWRRESDWLLRYRGPLGSYNERASEMADALAAYLAALERAGRFDLARPAAEWLARFGDSLRSEGSDVRTRLTESLDVRSMRERETALEPFARLFALGSQMVHQLRTFAQTPYGDPQYQEAQVALQQFETLLPDDLDTLLRLHSDVRGAIGG